MKGFFSRLHDSTPTGRSKSATKEPYKFWTPPVDPEQAYTQQNATSGDAPTQPITRPHGERRSSSRPKPSAPISTYDRNAASNAVAGPSTEKLPDAITKPNPSVPPTQYSRIPVQSTAKATSTRYRDYNDAKVHLPPPSATRPSHSTRTYGVHENPPNSSRHGMPRSESTPATAHEIWVMPPITSTSRHVEERRNEPVQQSETIEASHLYYSRNEERGTALEMAKREREKPRPRERDRDRGEDRDRDGDRVRERDRGREGESDRENLRHQGKDREVDPEQDRERNREKDLDKEKEIAQRGRERDRQRDLAREERERERREREGRTREKELLREKELVERERERREQEREREYQRQMDMGRDSDRERRDKEPRQQVDVPKDNDRLMREREREPRKQVEPRQRERERREREYKMEVANANRERRDREGVRPERDRAPRYTNPVAEVEREAERNREPQRQAEVAKAKREAERTMELQRQKDAKTDRDAERAKEIQRHREAANAEREARTQRQIEVARAEREAERAKELQRQEEAAKDAERAKELQRQAEVDRVRDLQRQAEAVKAEREAERLRQMETAKAERDAERAREYQHQAEVVKAEREAERLRQMETAKAEREAERAREYQRQAEVVKAEREAERLRQMETAKAERDAERAREYQRQAEAAKAEREAERAREYQRQVEVANAEREVEQAKELQRQEVAKAEREAERVKELRRQAETERAEREAERAEELQRQVEVSRAEHEAERAREYQRQMEAAKAEREIEHARDIQRQMEAAEKAEQEAERAKEYRRQAETAKAERDAERARELQRQIQAAKAEREFHRQAEAARAEREADRVKEFQRQAEFAKAEREAERSRESQRQAEAARAEREAERAKEVQREEEVAEAERVRDNQRQIDAAAQAEREAERVKELQRQAEAVRAEREIDRARETQRQLEAAWAEREAARAKESQRQMDAAKTEREAERVRDLQRQAETGRAEREAEHAKELQRQAEVARAERAAERSREIQRQLDAAKEREAQRARDQRQAEATQAQLEAEQAEEVQRQADIVKAEREAERLRIHQLQVEAAHAKREAERTRDLQRQAAARAEQEAEQSRELQRQVAQAEREAARVREYHRQMEATKAEREAELSKDLQRQVESEKAEREAGRAKELQRQAEAFAVEREAERARDAHRQMEAERQLEADHEAERTKQLQRLADAAKAEREAERAAETRRPIETEREAERAKEVSRPADVTKSQRTQEIQWQVEVAGQTEKQKERDHERRLGGDDNDVPQPRRDGQRRDRAKESNYIYQPVKEHDSNYSGGKETNLNVNKGSPEAKDSSRMDNAVVWPDQQQRDKATPREHRKMNKDIPRSRDRHRNYPRYRAEATDGEQDDRRYRRNTSTDRNGLQDHGSGWMSDSVQLRKPSRPVAIDDSAQHEGPEGSDGSARRKLGLLNMRNKRLTDEGTGGKDVRAHHNNSSEVVHRIIPATPSYSHSKALPNVPNTRFPSHSTVDLRQKSDRPSDPPFGVAHELSNLTPVNNDANGMPVRREITRLKLHSRREDLPISQGAAQTLVLPSPLLQPQITFQPSQQSTRTTDSSLQYPLLRPLAPTHSLEPSQNESKGRTNLPVPSPVPTTIILEPNVSTYQYPGTHQERLEVPWTSVTFDTTVKTEKPSLTHAYNHDHRTIRSATTLSQGPVAKDPTFQQFERDHQEYPQVHDSISNTPQIERTDAVTFPFPIPITTHQVVHKEDSRIPPTPLNSNQNLPTESSPGAQNAAALRSKHRESVAMMPVSLNEDSTDRPHSRKERSRHNSNPQPVLPREPLGKSHRIVDEMRDAGVANELPTTTIAYKDTYSSEFHAAATQPPSTYQKADINSMSNVPEINVLGANDGNPSAKLYLDLPILSKSPANQAPGLQTRTPDYPAQEVIGMSVNRPSTSTAWKHDDLGLSSHLPGLDVAHQGISHPQTTIFTESPTSGLTKADLAVDVKRNSSDSPHATPAPRNALYSNVSRSAGHPVVSEPYQKGLTQDSPQIQSDPTDYPLNSQTSNVVETNRLPQTTKRVSKHDSPLRSAMKQIETPDKPDETLAPDRIVNSSSGSLFVPASVPLVASSRPSVTTVPRQWHENPITNSYTPSLIAAPVQDRQRSSRRTINPAANMIPEQGPDVEQSQNGYQMDLSSHQFVNTRPANVELMDANQPSPARGDLADRIGVTDAPSLGFYTTNFSTAFSNAGDKRTLGLPMTELPVKAELDSGHVRVKQESGDRGGHQSSNARGQEIRPSGFHTTAEPPRAERTHSRQRSTEQTYVSGRKEVIDRPEQTRETRTIPEQAAGQSGSARENDHWRIQQNTHSQTPGIQHPVLAELLLSPLAPKTPMVVSEPLPSQRAQETRQRTVSSSRMNTIHVDLPKSRDFPSEVEDGQALPSVSLRNNPHEMPRKPLVESTRDVPTVLEGSIPTLQQPTIQSSHQGDGMRSVNRYNSSEPPKRAFRSGESALVQGSYTPSLRPTAIQPISNPIQEKETLAALTVESSWQSSNHRSEKPRMPTDPAREPPMAVTGSTAPQSDPLYPQGREGTPTYQMRQTSIQKPAIEPPPKIASEQTREYLMAHEARTYAIKASNSHLAASSSQTQTRQGYHAQHISDPAVPTSRVPSFSTFMPPSDQPNAIVQGTKTERITVSRYATSRSNLVDSVPSQDRRTDDPSKTVGHNQGLSTTRTAAAESSQYKVYPQTSADSGFPNVPQVAAASMQQSSSRHQHSTSLPTSLPPSTTFYPVNHVLREDPPRTSTPAQVQHKATHQVTSAPPHVSTTSLRIRKDPSEETILLTPTSLARPMPLKPTTSRQSVTTSAPPHVSQSSRTGAGFLSMFSKGTPPTQTTSQQYHSSAAKMPDSSPKSMQPQPEPTVSHSAPRRNLPPPISIPVTIHDTRHPPSHAFTPFRFITTKRNRAVSVASLEAQDGTAANTVIGSPTASMHSTAPIQPPLRDPRRATEEWRNKEEAAARALAKAKRRRQRPGVVFDIEEENPNDIKRRPRRVKTKGRSSSKQSDAAQT